MLPALSNHGPERTVNQPSHKDLVVVAAAVPAVERANCLAHRADLSVIETCNKRYRLQRHIQRMNEMFEATANACVRYLYREQ